MMLDEIIKDLIKDKTDQIIWLLLIVIMIVAGYFEYGPKGVLTPFILVGGFIGTMTGISEIYFLIVNKQRISKASYVFLPLTVILYIYWFVTEQYMAIAIFFIPSIVVVAIVFLVTYFKLRNKTHNKVIKKDV